MSCSPLSAFRALDLTDDKGLLCGKVFADLGADVVKIEPPGGDPARVIGPFLGDDPQPDNSLYWMAYNTGKRSITLDIESDEGKSVLRDLVGEADFLIESFPPGRMKRLGLDFPALKERNPALIYISISGFGQSGPYRDFKAPDIVVMALSGVMNLTGSPDRPPLRIGVPQAYLHAGTEAAVAGLIALWHRQETGVGQHIDVSAQECVTWEGLENQSAWDISRVNRKRMGTRRSVGASRFRFMFPCRDGHVYFYLLGGSTGPKSTRAVAQWIDEEGGADDFLRTFDWNTFEPATFTTETAEKLEPYFARFFLTKTKRELADMALGNGVLLAPVNTVADLVASPQLKSRQFWVTLEHPVSKSPLAYPGAPYISRESPYRATRRAPSLGEHNHTCRGERPSNEPRSSLTCEDLRLGGRTALDGIKVADFSWSILGPLAARYLADCGATVVRVESKSRPDILRLSHPFKDGVVHPDNSGFFANYNANKSSVTLDLQNPSGQAIAREVVKWADIVIENFSAGTMARFGLDYDSARRLNPAIIYASSTQLGQSGPEAAFKGYGGQGAVIAGFGEAIGYGDGEPLGPFGAYTDLVAHRYLLVSLLAALQHRRRTGRGQYIEQSQVESAIHFLAPAILDYSANGRILSRPGNREPNAAPHNAYRCKGNDRWCAIAVYTEEEWHLFRHAIGDPLWARDAKFAALASRKQNEEDLDRCVESWTVARTPEEVMYLLQSAGVAAGLVARAEDLHNDPQFTHRGHYWLLHHPRLGAYTSDAPGFRLSETPAQPRMPAPCLGEHNHLVCSQVLGMSDEAFIQADEEAAFG